VQVMIENGSVPLNYLCPLSIISGSIWELYLISCYSCVWQLQLKIKEGKTFEFEFEFEFAQEHQELAMKPIIKTQTCNHTIQTIIIIIKQVS
jgi:hypothetical protein